MVKCPKCKKEIDYLKHYESGEYYYKYFGNDEYEGIEFLGNSKVIDYECPECQEVIFTDEDKAKKFLKRK